MRGLTLPRNLGRFAAVGSVGNLDDRRCAVRRSLSLALLATLIAIVHASAARAGGSWLYPDRGAYVPGDGARLHGGFSPNGAYVGTRADGPYVAYLLPEGASIERTKVPPSAIRLGELRVVRAESGTRAVVTFSVPDVPTGWYHVGYCNDPCTVDGIGDLIGSWRFVVAPTRLEGRSLRVIDRLENRIDSARRKAHAHARAEQKRLQGLLEARMAELHEVRTRMAVLEAGRTSPSEGRPLMPGWAAGVLVIAVIGAAAILRRRRSSVIVAPDTVPGDLVQGDLVDRDRAGV